MAHKTRYTKRHFDKPTNLAIVANNNFVLKIAVPFFIETYTIPMQISFVFSVDYF